jgi:hypothetical protein
MSVGFTVACDGRAASFFLETLLTVEGTVQLEIMSTGVYR